MKITKEQLIKDNAALNVSIDQLSRKDKEIRHNLTTILKDLPRGGYANFSNNREEDMTWIDIAFYMGSLRSDSRYSLALAKIEELTMQLGMLKNPEGTI